MKWNRLIMLLPIIAITQIGFAQNNAIFSGGNDDGWSNGNFVQDGNNIFQGGVGDGWNYNNFSQSINNIYGGGDGDGWNFNSYSQAVNNIYNGGDGDGWAYNSFAQMLNQIFSGGEGDGWAFNNFTQAGNDIFNGGIGDGWASTYMPETSLPVMMTNFTAEASGKNSLLKWKTSQEINTKKFEIERSSDGLYFVFIGTVSASGISSGSQYQFVDAQPIVGTNFYRLKIVDENGTYSYTPTRTVIFAASDANWVKVFPNPATTKLGLELKPNSMDSNKQFMLINSQGVVVKRWRYANSAVNKFEWDVSSLSSGMYFLHINNGAQQTTRKIVIQH